MIPASKKLDFCSLLTTHLREEGYSAHIVASDILNPEWDYGKKMDITEKYLPCVEVGFPKPSLQFMIDPGAAAAGFGTGTLYDLPKDTCFWRSVDIRRHHLSPQVLEETGASFWHPLVPIYDLNLVGRILGIIVTTEHK